MPMPKRDTVQRTVRIPSELDERLRDLLTDKATLRTMYGGLSAVIVEATTRFLNSIEWKNKLKRLKAEPPILQLDIGWSCEDLKRSTDYTTVDFYAHHEPGIPGSSDQPEVPRGWVVDEVMIKEQSVLGVFPELEAYAEKLINQERG